MGWHVIVEQRQEARLAFRIVDQSGEEVVSPSSDGELLLAPEATANTLAASSTLVEAVREFCAAYEGNRSAHLGSGQARRSLDRFQAILRALGVPRGTSEETTT
jgi:hypothetical protein